MALPESKSGLNEPHISQLSTTALQIALVDLLKSWNVIPESVVGHSSGEIAAAFCVGAISRESAWTIAYYRGLVSAQAASLRGRYRGGMMSVALSESHLATYMEKLGPELAGGVQVGCVNSPQNVTITGSEHSIDALKAILDDEQVFTRKLTVPVAYHSVQMESVAETYNNLLETKIVTGLGAKKSVRPNLYSSVTGGLLDPEELLQSRYWSRNLVSKVLFCNALQSMHSASSKPQAYGTALGEPVCFIEVGPHGALERSVRETLNAASGVRYCSTMRRGTSSHACIKELIGQLFVQAYPVAIHLSNSQCVTSAPSNMLVDLPNYSFNHTRSYWLESRLSKNRRFRGYERNALLGSPTDDWNVQEPKWRFTIRKADLPWVVDHVVSHIPNETIKD
jgi:acyl transferase domain-containing protein